MNGWERNGKRLCKILVWVAAYFMACWAFSVQHSMNVMGVVIACGFVDQIMETIWPTAASLPSTVRGGDNG